MNGKSATKNYVGGTQPFERTFNLLMKILVYSSAFYFFSFVTADTDLWGHIKFGEDLWAAKSLHRFDIYSYTAFGAEWINHEWLAELLMFSMYSTFGSAGLLMGKLFVGFAIIYILLLIASPKKLQSLSLWHSFRALCVCDVAGLYDQTTALYLSFRVIFLVRLPSLLRKTMTSCGPCRW